jgi:hypothetical protein
MSPGRRVLLAAVAVGCLLGTFSILADGIIGGRLFGILGNIASPWGLAAFFVGRRATSSRLGATAGALTLVVGVTTYYLGTALRGTSSPMPISCGQQSRLWPDPSWA